MLLAPVGRPAPPPLGARITCGSVTWAGATVKHPPSTEVTLGTRRLRRVTEHLSTVRLLPACYAGRRIPVWCSVDWRHEDSTERWWRLLRWWRGVHLVRLGVWSVNHNAHLFSERR